MNSRIKLLSLIALMCGVSTTYAAQGVLVDAAAGDDIEIAAVEKNEKDVNVPTSSPAAIDVAADPLKVDDRGWLVKAYADKPVLTVVAAAGITITIGLLIDYAVRGENSVLYSVYAALKGNDTVQQVVQEVEDGYQQVSQEIAADCQQATAYVASLGE